jgi:DNA-binding PadR family transcriptional regulator
MTPKPSDPTNYLPLRAVEFQIALTLSRGARHGYAIIQDAEDRGEGRAVPGLATLYRALRRMEGQGLIERAPVDDAVDERRRPYRLTALGRAVAEAEAHRLELQVRAAADARLLGKRATG